MTRPTDSDRPLRILQILRAPVGGLFRHVRDLTAALSERGHAVGVVADSLTADALTAERLEGLRPYAALGLHRLPMPRVAGPGDFTTPMATRRLADELRIDVLHGHGAKGGLYARLSRGRTRVALYTPHGGVLHFSPASPSGMLFQTIERLLLPRTDAVIFESNFARERFKEIIGQPACPDPVIHNGLTEADFERIAPTDEHDFVFVGEFRALKGIHHLLEALVSVKRPDGTPATLLLVGAGPDAEEFHAEIVSLGLKHRVSVEGPMPARAAFQRGRVVVAPSLAESLPYIVLEAAAAGLPVISTRVGGIAEIFGPTAESLVPAGDSEALRAAMQRTLDSPAAASAEADTRLAYVREEFPIARMAERIEALYRQTMRQR